MNYILVVEDTVVDRQLITQCLANCGFEVQCVEDAFQARDAIAISDPLLIVLDIELPKMSGGEFLGHLMRHHPLPVVIVTRESSAGKRSFEKYQSLGAVCTVCKPSSAEDCAHFSADLARIVKTICNFRIRSSESKRVNSSDESIGQSDREVASEPCATFSANPIAIAIGASAGGPVATSEIVRHFPANSPPVLIAQHISDRFSMSLVRGLRRSTKMEVSLAEHGEYLCWGKIYVAPPECHTEVDGEGRIKILSTVPTDRFTPSVNVLFNSLARNRQISVIAALLTGMGCDGADGLLRLRNSGAKTIAQDRETCAVFGMPARAVEIGAAEEVLGLEDIGPRIMQLQPQLAAKKKLLKLKPELEPLTH